MTSLVRDAAVPLTCWQLLTIAVVLAMSEPSPITVAAVAVGVVAVLMTTGRMRGRRTYAWLALALSYRLRTRDSELPGGPNAGGALLDLIAPEAVRIIGGAATDGDDPVFMISRKEGITAVLQLVSTGRDLTATMPPPESFLPAHDDGALAFAVQAVYHAGVNRSSPPRVWIALQALRTAERYLDADLEGALSNTVRRVGRRLRRDGLPCLTPTEDETMTTFAALAHVNAGRGKVRERWAMWQSGPITQAVYQLDGWERLPSANATQSVGWLLTAAVPAAVTVAVVVRRAHTGRGLAVSAVVRVAAMSAAAVDSAAAELTRLARERGLHLERLDGRQAWGVAATLPFGLVA